MERGLLVVPAVLAAVVLAVLAAVRVRRRTAEARAAAARQEARERKDAREREEALIRTVEQLSDAHPERHGIRAV